MLIDVDAASLKYGLRCQFAVAFALNLYCVLQISIGIKPPARVNACQLAALSSLSKVKLVVVQAENDFDLHELQI